MVMTKIATARAATANERIGDLQSLEAPTRSNAHKVRITDWRTGEAPPPTANNNRSYDQAVSLIGCVLLTQEIPT